jgi:hypothetical protein
VIDPAYTSEPFGEALAGLMEKHGMAPRDAVERLGKSWRHTLDKLPSIDRRRLPPDHLRQIRELFELPAGYFAEERLQRVLDDVKRDPALRDGLYFALLKGGSRAANELAARQAEEDDLDESFDVPVAAPTFHELAIVVVDVSECARAGGEGPPPARLAIAELLDDIAASPLNTSISTAFVKVDELGVASTRPVSALEQPGERFLDAIWARDAEGPDEDQPAAPNLADALEIAHSKAVDFLEVPHDVPAAAVVVVLSSGACDDPDRAREVAAKINTLPFAKVVTCDVVGHDPDSPEVALLRELATHPESAPARVDDTSLGDWLHLRAGFVSA